MPGDAPLAARGFPHCIPPCDALARRGPWLHIPALQLFVAERSELDLSTLSSIAYFTRNALPILPTLLVFHFD
jgi:hypothetical protein